MVTFDSLNAHFDYLDVTRHWHSESEKYAGGDALMTYINEGWSLKETVFLEEYWHAGVRLVTIFHCELEHDGETVKMPVLANPYVTRILNILPVQIRPLSERQAVQQGVQKSN